METLYIALATILGKNRVVSPDTKPFTIKELGVIDQNIPALIKQGFLKVYKEADVPAPKPEPVVVEEECEKSKSEGGIWVFTKKELEDHTLPELLSCIDALCEQHGIKQPNIKTLIGAKRFLSKDLK